MNVKSVSPRVHDAASSQPLELVGDGLWLHPEFFRDLTHTQLTRASQGMKHS